MEGVDKSDIYKISIRYVSLQTYLEKELAGYRQQWRGVNSYFMSSHIAEILDGDCNLFTTRKACHGRIIR